MINRDIIIKEPPCNRDPLAGFSFRTELLDIVANTAPKEVKGPYIDTFSGFGAVANLFIERGIVQPQEVICVDCCKPGNEDLVKIPINQWRYWNLERLVTNITLQPENLPSEVTELKGKAGIFTALQAEGFGPHWIARIANYVLKPGGHAVIDYPSDLEWKSKSHFPQSYFGSLRPLQNNHIWWIKE